MKAVINQPTYLPWLGYFDLIDQADVFVVLDNVQFAKRSWQQRNRIRTANGLQWLTVPVRCHGRFEQLVKDVEIADSNFWSDHTRSIEHAYKRAQYFPKYFPTLVARLEELSKELLVDVNLGLIRWVLEALGLMTPVVRASNLEVNGKRSELLAAICEKVGADRYFSPVGSAVYLLDEQNAFCERAIKISFQNYHHPAYAQLFTPFEPYASVVDLIFNHGPDSLRILRQGRRDAYSVDEMTAIQKDSGSVQRNEASSALLTH